MVAVSGSLRNASRTRRSLEIVLEGVTDAGGTGELIDLEEYMLPPLNPEDEAGDDVVAFRRSLRTSDAIVLGTPMYHGSYSGVLKNAIDHCGFDEFEGKTVGLLAVAGGSFPVTALDHLRSVCRALDAWVLPHQAAVPNSGSAFQDGQLVDDGLETRLETLGRRTVTYANIEPEPPTFESDHNEGA
ncbi:NADPH-dependent FMN reductase [Halalkaliarchaeum desulfuricum]|uniref:NADPH-dependent FMN reductase n=1 Tax=Halalkaliarchaeum desulfuricum TaxID=2055893 RepID=A0A343TI12_9EURY|nr:NADPH-dependent FMN reductase [Halalkaliarchaeum desulfuricum]